VAIIPKSFEKQIVKKLDKLTDKIPGVGFAKEIGKGIADVAGEVGQALGIGKSEADKRKDRSRKFHREVRECNWAHIEKTAQPEGALGGKGTRFKGLALEALWMLAQRAKGYTCAEIQAAIAGNGGAEARGGRLPNLDGTPNYTRDQWEAARRTSGTAPAAEDSSPAPAPRKEPTRSTPTGGAADAPAQQQREVRPRVVVVGGALRGAACADVEVSEAVDQQALGHALIPLRLVAERARADQAEPALVLVVADAAITPVFKGIDGTTDRIVGTYSGGTRTVTDLNGD